MSDTETSTATPPWQLDRYGDRCALVIDGMRLSYAEVADQVAVERNVLAALGLGTGSRLGLLMHNSTQMVVTLLAAWELGVVVVPINTRYRPDEIGYVVEHSDIEAILTTTARAGAPDLLARLASALPGVPTDATHHQADTRSGAWSRVAPSLRAVAVRDPDAAGGTTPRVTWLETAEPDAPSTRSTNDRELLLVYTSGTTSHPKGCVHDLNAFLSTARKTAVTMGVEEGSVVWDPLPFFHTGGLLPLLGALDAGATFCSEAHFEPAKALAVLEAERVTAAYPAFSTLLTALMDDPSFPDRDLSALRWILAIGPRSLLERVQAAMPNAVQVSCYGCTEIGGVTVYNDRDDDAERRASTSGQPFDGVEVRIVDALNAPVAPGVKGEIVVRGASVLRRYHRDSHPPVDDDGWFHTGDLGVWDGVDLTFDGRLKDTFKVGGENVGAAEIEYVMLAHPAVTMAAAVSVPDDRLGEVPAVFVELKPQHHADESELIAFCASRLASFKVPRVIRFVTEWPMSATKIQKFRLRDTLLEQLSTESSLGEVVS